MSLSLIGRRRYFAFAPDFVPIAARPVVRATQDYTADDEATQVCNFLQNLLKIISNVIKERSFAFVVYCVL